MNAETIARKIRLGAFVPPPKVAIAAPVMHIAPAPVIYINQDHYAEPIGPKHPGPFKRAVIAQIIAGCAEVYGLKPEQVSEKSRMADVVSARRLAIHVASGVFQNRSEIARLFNLDHTTVLHALKRQSEIDGGVLSRQRARYCKFGDPLSEH